MVKKNELIVRGRSIREDGNGLVSLSDIWSAAGFKVNQKPSQWQRLPSSAKLMTALMERLGLVGKSHKGGKIRVQSIYYSRKDIGTYAHPILACAYAGYLSPKLEVEVREIWLRYRSGDATLADDILNRASPEANEWAGVRALSRATRSRYTSTLKNHGVEAPVDYAICTNETYIALFDSAARDLRHAKGLTKSANLRDASWPQKRWPQSESMTPTVGERRNAGAQQKGALATFVRPSIATVPTDTVKAGLVFEVGT